MNYSNSQPVSMDLPRNRPLLLPDEGEGCLHELFEAQADLHPGAIALLCDGSALTYAELDAQANRLARYLKRHGAGPERFVALFFERSMSPIIAILACLKSGSAYVPIDPAYPADRIRHILGETAPVLMLSEGSLAERASDVFTGPLALLDTLDGELDALPAGRLSRAESGVSPSDLCYVIYTSGTTGHPKGVMAEHRHAHRFTLAFNRVCGTGPSDRVYQGFSLGFDGSVEEIWMAFSNGSALLCPTATTPRFGDELGQFLSQNGITYLSTVPTLLSTLTTGIDTLRTLVVSGEICPPELVNRWARPGLRMLNVYGPTEATVNTTAAECIAGQPVTIGKPLPGYELYILDADLRPVTPGEKGELFVGGETLARGYLKQPQLTAERFMRVAGMGPGGADKRLYRTGDLVRENERGELEFFGRLDGQVKIRGYRVELAEIESVLLEHAAIRSASVKLVDRDGLKELAAYVVLRETNGQAAELDRGELLARMETRLPPYMIPAHLDVLDSLPMLASGKVDRNRLPAPVAPLLRGVGKCVAPESELEGRIAALWARVFGLPEVSVVDDFFHDLGGHSLLAAQMVTQLRRQIPQQVTIRDAYKFATVRKLAAHIESLPRPGQLVATVQPATTPSSRAVFAAQSPWTRGATALLQALSIYLLYGIAAIPFALFFLFGRSWFTGGLSFSQLLLFTVALPIALWPVLMAVSVASKWLLIGRYKPGSYPLWGFYHFRFWLSGRLQSLSGAGALAGTPLLPLYFRLMGARVGRGCTLDTAMVGAWDLISIGDETSIGADSQLLGYRVENGMLHIGRVDVGSRCFIGIHSALGLHTRMEDGSRLDDQSLLPDHGVIAAGEGRRGSPALPAEVAVPGGDARPLPRHPVLFGLAHLVLIEVVAVLSILPALPLLGILAAALFYVRDSAIAPAVLCLAASVPAGVLVSCLWIALLKRLVLSRVAPGVYPVDSLLYLRKWLSDGIMRASRGVLLPLYTTLYLPPWLRMLGAKIGPRAELSTVWHFSPELIDVGAESFFADGSIVGGRRAYGGRFAIGLNRIGRRSFVGNSAILPVGTGLGERCLLGVQSLPPVHAGADPSVCSTTPDGTEWLGSPAFALPHRPKVGNFDDAVTFRPTAKLYLQRAIIDGLRIVIPGYIGLGSAIAAVVSLNFLYERFGLTAMLAAAPAIAILLGLASILAVVGLKWLVMGKFKPVIKPLWSMYVWLNEMVNGAYESVMAPALGPYLGTPFVGPLLRLIGCRIGRHTFIETTLFSEFDLVEIGDHAALNVGAVIQNHLFEDRIMKSSYLKIGSECSVGNMAVVLYDSELQDGAVLGPLSLLMKGETLAPGERWHGIPCTQQHVAAKEEPLLLLTRPRPEGPVLPELGSQGSRERATIPAA